jgi:protein TonB
MRLRALNGRPQDRLATAVFVAALLHGLAILGIRFTAPSGDERALPTLEVLLVSEGPAEEENPDAAYIAERGQRGAGTTRERQRASLPESASGMLEHRGEADGESFAPPASAATAGGAQVLSTAAQRRRGTVAGDDLERAAAASRPIESRPALQVGISSTAADETLRLRGEPSPDDRLLADTRESQIAAYLDGWKRRIERVGTVNFPNEARRRTMSGNPVLEVAIRADGTLERVLVRRSSGHRELDAAAVGIVRLASPFDPFPPAMRARYPVVRFAYEWQFLEGRMSEGAVWSPPP